MHVKKQTVIHKGFYKRLWHGFFILGLSVFYLSQSNAQEKTDYKVMLDDILYQHSRDLGYSGEVKGAKVALSVLIERNPGHLDALVLMARFCAWEKETDRAREYVEAVIARDKCHHEAMLLVTDLEIWEGDFAGALKEVDKALECNPGDETFLLKKAGVLFLMGSTTEANEILDYLLTLDPGNEDAADLKRQVEAPGYFHYRENNYLLAGYYGEFHQEPFTRRMHAGTIGYSHYTGLGPVTGKLNFANTYLEGTGLTRYPSLQYELESYPRLSNREYLFLNYAFSDGRVFPRHRGAFEFFRGLPRGFEASLGLRYLYWDRSYLFYSASAGKYYSDLWFSVRTWLFPGDDGLASSWYFYGRKYFKTADDYAGIIAGFGFSPDETLMEISDRLHLRSYSSGLEFSSGIGPSYLIRGSILYSHEEYFNESWRGRWTLNLGIRYYL
jgi:YaiO family outer membrane protein